MIRLTLAAVLVVSSLAACGGTQSRVTPTPYRVEREQVEGFTRVALRDVRAMRPDGGVVGFELVAWEENPDVRVRTTTVSSDWQYRDCRELSFMADGEEVPVQNVRHEGEMVEGQAMEHLVGEVVGWQFRKVAKADRVQAELCRELVEFQPPEREALAELVRVAWEGEEPVAPEWPGIERRDPPSYDYMF